MLIFSNDKLTIIDTDSGSSITAENNYPGTPNDYDIYANYQTCGKRLLIRSVDYDIATEIMEHIFNNMIFKSAYVRLRFPLEGGDTCHTS